LTTLLKLAATTLFSLRDCWLLAGILNKTIKDLDVCWWSQKGGGFDRNVKSVVLAIIGK
jgi:hypothetical protein